MKLSLELVELLRKRFPDIEFEFRIVLHAYLHDYGYVYADGRKIGYVLDSCHYRSDEELGALLDEYSSILVEDYFNALFASVCNRQLAQIKSISLAMTVIP